MVSAVILGKAKVFSYIGTSRSHLFVRHDQHVSKPRARSFVRSITRHCNVAAIVELPPAGTLAGIAKRELRGVPTHAVKSPADLDGLAELAPGEPQ